MTNELAKKTISNIQRALDNKGTTAITEIIQIIRELAAKAFSISVSELSQLIGRDPTITTKVICAANTFGFNPKGQPIATITEAIHTVGFEKIRNLSISLLLVENAGKTLNPYEQREMAAIAVCSGLLAQTLCQGSKKNCIDPELAFVCASLRNYGKLLMTTFLIDQYREAQSIASETKDSDAAFCQVFGITPLQLGQHLLESTQLPPTIMSALKSIPLDVLSQVANNAEDEILVASEISVRVCEIAFDEKIGPDQFNDAITNVLTKFERSLPIGLETINTALIDIAENLQMFNRAIGLSDINSPAAQMMSARINGEPIPAKPKSLPQPAPRPLGIGRAAPDPDRKATQKLGQMMQPGAAVDFAEIYNAVAKSIMGRLDLESCLVFISEDKGSDSFSARYGVGPLFAKVRNRPLISAKKKDVFSICIGRKEDILIQDTQAGKIRSVIPDWLPDNSSSRCIFLMPVTFNDSVFAIILGTSPKESSINLDKGDLNRLKQMRAQLSSLRKVTEQRQAQRN